MTDRIIRILDIAIAALLVVLLSPLLVAIAVAARLAQGAPILYRADRIGKDGEPFEMKKFRTMVVGSDLGPSSTTAADSRVTPLGRALRHYKLDELPQLFNVVVGEMSLVGPRPQIAWAVDRYCDAERAILQVRPGLTDMASVWFRNEAERLAQSTDPDGDYLRFIAPGKNALALAYVNHRTTGLHLKILFMTMRAMAGVNVRHEITRLTGIDADELAEKTS